jgi:hypothetical protein
MIEEIHLWLFAQFLYIITLFLSWFIDEISPNRVNIKVLFIIVYGPSFICLVTVLWILILTPFLIVEYFKVAASILISKIWSKYQWKNLLLNLGLFFYRIWDNLLKFDCANQLILLY